MPSRRSKPKAPRGKEPVLVEQADDEREPLDEFAECSPDAVPNDEVARMMQPSDGKGKDTTTSEDLINRRVHIWLSLTEVKGSVTDETLAEVISAIERVRNLCPSIRCIHLNEEAQGNEDNPIGSRLLAMLADTGILIFRAGEVTKAIRVACHEKFAVEDSITFKAFGAWNLWITRTMAVSFLLLDPSKIAHVTAQHLDWARTAGDTAWDSQITTERVITMEREVRKAQSAMRKDSKFLLRKVLGARVPTPTRYTQAFWISGEQAMSHNITCSKCNDKRMGLPALKATKCADSSGSPNLGYAYQNSGKWASASTPALYIRKCTTLTTPTTLTILMRPQSMMGY